MDMKKGTLYLSIAFALGGCAPAPDNSAELAAPQAQVAELQAKDSDIPGPSNEDANNVALPDIAGNWLIHSQVGSDGPMIQVHCTLVQNRSVLTGSCTPEMANPEASDVKGGLTRSTARWGYDVVFNGNAGRVDFVATSLAADALAGTLTLSGMQAPFTAERE